MDEVFLDSNILIRFVVKDDIKMYEASKEFFTQVKSNKKKGLIPILVFQEVVWVLNHYYKLTRKEIVESLLEILTLESIQVYDARKDQILDLLKFYGQSNLDLVDIYLHLEAKKISGKIFSFDEQLMRVGMDFLATA